MSIFNKILKNKREEKQLIVPDLQKNFNWFMRLLENNHKTLKIAGDMEEKSQGDYVFDINYIRSGVRDIRKTVKEIIDCMIALGGEPYLRLNDAYNEINEEIDRIMHSRGNIEKDDYVKFLIDMNTEDINSVGSKNARLGEIKSKLKVPVPRGFGVTTWAYKQFLDAYDLQKKINGEFNKANIKSYNDLEILSHKLKSLIAEAPVPKALIDEINKAYDELKAFNRQTYDTTLPPGKEGLVSVRSSAIGEDTGLSFAGQYETYLNIEGPEIIKRYIDVIKSKFSPKAIYYYLSHDLNEAELAMSVGFVTMVNARASGVIYTRNPLDIKSGSLYINSIYGLGALLVDGTINPDVFRVSHKKGKINNLIISKKEKQLIMNDSGILEEQNVNLQQQEQPSLSDEEIKMLADIAIKIEKHYGRPQDIEWAISKDSRPFILQTRPLRVIKYQVDNEMPDTSSYELVTKGGITVYPGAGAGFIKHVGSTSDLTDIPDGAVLVSDHPFPGLITALERANALITKVGSIASHLATISREYKLPTVFGLEDIGALEEGMEVTVDATHSRIYRGSKHELIEALSPERDCFDDDPTLDMLKNVLSKISPLNLLHPAEPDFTIENCKTFHDITRYAHQKSMQEMFSGFSEICSCGESIGMRLISEIPLEVDIIYIDRDKSVHAGQKEIRLEDIDCIPMLHFWQGIMDIGWPAPPETRKQGLISVVATKRSAVHKKDFSNLSFALLSKEFMILSLKMGYHFTTFEAMVTDDLSNNYIKMQFKAGGAQYERRKRRIKLLSKVLTRMGFENEPKADYIDAMMTYIPKDMAIKKLELLGRLAMLTKQLDMALSNDKITKFYTNDIIRKLDI